MNNLFIPTAASIYQTGPDLRQTPVLSMKNPYYRPRRNDIGHKKKKREKKKKY